MAQIWRKMMRKLESEYTIGAILVINVELKYIIET
jgi:hypothetical protein